jgi:hypothetical protein
LLIGWVRLVYLVKILEVFKSKIRIEYKKIEINKGLKVIKKFIMPLMYRTPRNPREGAIFATKR